MDRKAQSNSFPLPWNVRLEQSSSGLTESAWLQNGIPQQLKTFWEDFLLKL